MNITSRLKILRKIAQQAQNPDLSPEAAKTQVISGSPPQFIATNVFPTIIPAFNQSNAALINDLSNSLNYILYYLSNTKYHLQWARLNNFVIDSSITSSQDLKYILQFTKVVYNNFFTNNLTAFKSPLSKEEIATRVNRVKSSSSLTNFSSGPIMNQLVAKLGNSPKQEILSILAMIK